MRNRNRGELVWIPDEEVFGELIGPLGAYFSRVIYVKGGIEFDVLMENDDFMTTEELFF